MWIENQQKYDLMLWENQRGPLPLKEILSQDLQISMRFYYILKKNQLIRVNGQSIKAHETVYPGDIIEIRLLHERNEYLPEKMPIPVLYEDHDLMVVEKSPGIVVHPTKGHGDGTLANGLIYLFQEKKIHSKIRFVNRLDMDTSGILIVAKNSYTHSLLTSQTTMEKRYFAFVSGIVMPSQGMIDLPIALASDEIHREVSESGQPSQTSYRVIETFNNSTLLELQLHTGRTHQIRVHMSHIGHPLLGDELYGGDLSLIQRQALHCFSLSFHSPRLSEKITIQSKLPQDLRELKDRL